ncbi:hypothetical protein N8083_01190 [Candidatus Pacebacteria bacterium]|nr:hypothetical protein [Candidatus Paceibacterota bacterium]
MKILIASALFPPDIAVPAPYIKELATRLSKKHTVTVLTYGEIPEQIPHVHIATVSKRLPALYRISKLTSLLIKKAKKVDHILIQNGASTELPSVVVGFFYKKKIFLQLSDQKIKYKGWRKILHQLACAKSKHVIRIKAPLQRPETLPFDDMPDEAFSNYETSWQDHLRELERILV